MQRPNLITRPQVAKICGMRPGTVASYIDRKIIPKPVKTISTGYRSKNLQLWDRDAVIDCAQGCDEYRRTTVRTNGSTKKWTSRSHKQRVETIYDRAIKIWDAR